MVAMPVAMYFGSKLLATKRQVKDQQLLASKL
jgi:hypothetical protein